MKENIKEFDIHIRMSFDEREKIKKRADKTGKSLSTFMRDSALGVEIKEKPDEEFYVSVIKPIGNFTRLLSELERLLYHKNFFDERVLQKEIEEWRKFRMDIKKRFL